MKARAAMAVAIGLAAPAQAQDVVGRDHATGLPWAVAAPQGASWRLTCRFGSAVLYMNQYDRRHWVNRFRRHGRGDDAGRLPTDNGQCDLVKTGGDGPVGLALVKNGERSTAGVRAVGQSVHVNVF